MSEPIEIPKMVWPPDFIGEVSRRASLMEMLTTDALVRKVAMEKYAEDPVLFINDNVWVYEPRNANRKLPVKIPVVTFGRQEDFIHWMHERYQTKTSGPVEKSRDSGATWMACAFAVWVWRFQAGASVGFGSRKEMLVDKKGDPGSIFEKIRTIVGNLPHYMIPEGYNERDHSNYMRLINPENNATIVGEAGDNIGRGGRSSMYIVDEAAFIDRPQLIEASLTANTDVRIDISSPRVGTLFNEASSSAEHKFVFDLRDVPWHTEEWIEQKRLELERRGMLDVFAQEYLRDSTAGLDGQLISSDMLDCAIDACERLGIEPSGFRRAGMDVADGGRDRHALAIRHGIELIDVRSRAGVKAGEGGRWAMDLALRRDCDEFLFDSIGVGAGVATVADQMADQLKNMSVEGWSAAGKVVDARRFYEGKKRNADMFMNAKSQAWWSMRDRFIETQRVVSHFTQTGELPEDFDEDAIISISSKCRELRELKSELCQITYTANQSGKIVIRKTPDGHRSPNLADAVMIAFSPVRQKRLVTATVI